MQRVYLPCCCFSLRLQAQQATVTSAIINNSMKPPPPAKIPTMNQNSKQNSVVGFKPEQKKINI